MKEVIISFFILMEQGKATRQVCIALVSRNFWIFLFCISLSFFRYWHSSLTFSSNLTQLHEMDTNLNFVVQMHMLPQNLLQTCLLRRKSSTMLKGRDSRDRSLELIVSIFHHFKEETGSPLSFCFLRFLLMSLIVDTVYRPPLKKQQNFIFIY